MYASLVNVNSEIEIIYKKGPYTNSGVQNYKNWNDTFSRRAQ